MVVSLIVAVSENKVIGKDNNLVWHLPADMKFFKDTTKGHFVIMGRRNYESIPHRYRPLPKRTNVIVTRQDDYKAEGCLIVNSVEAAIELAQKAGDKEPFVIGGGQIYKYAIKNNLVDRIYLTKVHTEIDGDTYFDDLDGSWKLVNTDFHPSDEKHIYAFTFQTFER
ncbi:MAG: diacylglycerol kinase [Flavobacteriales bacterium]|nr:diacylglycerol kinase [Flavobacteriales bacterium]|tara:strand:+ start:2288 stop:2788 length:501 start_codon:yes stop_codon:yes gene_type:complete